MKIYCCLSLCGHGFIEEHYDFIVRLAHEMLRRNTERKRITSKMTKHLNIPLEGILATKRRFVFVNNYLSGFEFHASIECERGITQACLLVKPGEIDSSARWTEASPDDPYIQPHDPSAN